MPETLETDKLPAAIRHARTVLTQLWAEDAALAESLRDILPGYALQLEKNNQPFTPESLLDDARKGPQWLKAQKAVKAAPAAAKTALEIYDELISRLAKPVEKPTPEKEGVPPARESQTFLNAARAGNLPDVKRLQACVSGDQELDLFMKALSFAATGSLPVATFLCDSLLDRLSPKGQEIALKQALVQACRYDQWLIVDHLYEKITDMPPAVKKTMLDAALETTIQSGSLEVLEYFHKECADLDVHTTEVATIAGEANQWPVLKYLFENMNDVLKKHDEAKAAQLTLNLFSAGLSAAAARHENFDTIKYLVENVTTSPARNVKNISDSTHTREWKLSFAATLSAQRNDWASVEYLVNHGAETSRLKPSQREALDIYRARVAHWQKIVHVTPHRLVVHENPSLFKKATIDFILPILEREGYKPAVSYNMAFQAAALFQSPARVMQYLQQWGKEGRQPLHDLIQGISLPQKDCTFSLKNWGDAVLKCGPSMAKLVRFADKLYSPAQTADSKSWSYYATRDICAKFGYEHAAENPQLATLCFEHNVKEETFNKALLIAQNHTPATKALPEITIEGVDFGMTGGKFYRLPADDVRGLFLGEITNCCQSIGGHGHTCAEYGFKSEQGGFYVVENGAGQIVSQTFAWRSKDGGMCFDTLETLGQNVTSEQWVKILRKAAEELTRRTDHHLNRLTVGLGGGSPQSALRQSFSHASHRAKPLDYTGYTEAKEQVTIWERLPGPL